MERIEIEKDNLSIDRIEEKCLHCGVCLKTCQSLNNLANKDCLNCGQCLLTCPSGALIPKFTYKQVLNYLHDTNYTLVVLTSPAVRVAIGDEFGYEAGEFLEGKMVSALRNLGFDYVFDTTFGADLTVMEEAYELVEHLKQDKKPLFTSCCPSWVLYMQKYHENDLNYLSTCKSPIAMLGAMVKTYFADFNNIPQDKIITVALTPCVSKKSEMAKYRDIDFVITTRELALMIRECAIDFKALPDSLFDKMLGLGSGAGLIFASSGGVMEAALRTAYYMLNKEKAPQEFYHLTSIRGEKDFVEATIDMKIKKIKIAVVNKIINAQTNYAKLKDYDFVEVMACPGGCVGGGGQPVNTTSKQKEYREERIKTIYNIDNNKNIKESFDNPEIQDAYRSYISKNKVSLHTNHKCNSKLPM